MPLEVRHGGHAQPYAVRTALGWTVNGPVGVQPATSTLACNFIHAENCHKVTLEAQVEKFWKLDIGQELATGLQQMSLDDRKVVDVWERSRKTENGHYQLDILFKTNLPELPVNRSVAEKRLQNLGKRLPRDQQPLNR